MKKAFTLSETLMIFGIIGIVLAVTLPTVIKKYQNAILESRFKKAYSDISQLSYIFSHEIGTCNVENFNEMNTIFKNRYSNSTFINKKYKYIWKNYPKTANPGQMLENCLSSSTNNFLFPNQSLIGFCINANGYLSLTIDLNGYDKKPNALGHDLFYFTFDSQTCKPSSPIAGGANVCSKNHTGNIYTGVNCATYAMRNVCPDNSNKKYFECLP